MKLLAGSIAGFVIALAPGAILAADEQPAQDTSSAAARKHFDRLDNDRDGRLSKLEAGSDPEIVFSRVDTDDDGYIDLMEYLRRDAADR
jgi:hypothetical protein